MCMISFLIVDNFGCSDGGCDEQQTQWQGPQFTTGSLYKEPLATNYCAFHTIIKIF